MKFRSILGSLLILLCFLTSNVNAAPYRYHRTWRSGAYGWGSFHHSSFIYRHNWQYRDNRVGVKDRPGHFYRPWAVKRREFHNSEDNFSHRFYH